MSVFDMSLDLVCRALCGQPLMLAPTGRLRSQRERMSPELEGWIRFTTRLLVVQVVWATIYVGVSLSRRGGAGRIGLFLNPVLAGSGVVGLVGTLSLSWPLLTISMVTSLTLFCAWITFVMLNYAGSLDAGDPMAWVVLALFLPGLIIDLLIVIGCVPLLQALRRAESQEPARSARAVDVEAVRPEAPPPTEAATSAAVAMPDVTPAVDGARPCPVCFVNAPDTVLLDCKHVVCAACAATLQRQRHKCPICRGKIKSSMKVFL